MVVATPYYPASMPPSLPDRIDPWLYCAKGETLQGRLALRELKRLAPLLASAEGVVDFVLEFSRDPDGRAVIRGEVEAAVQVVCQRCLEVMNWKVSQPVDLALVKGIDEAGRLPEQVDPLLLPDQSLDPREILEDELILALPTTPRHPEAQCSARIDSLKAASARREEDVERHRPFAILSSLKRGDERGER